MGLGARATPIGIGGGKRIPGGQRSGRVEGPGPPAIICRKSPMRGGGGLGRVGKAPLTGSCPGSRTGRGGPGGLGGGLPVIILVRKERSE